MTTILLNEEEVETEIKERKGELEEEELVGGEVLIDQLKKLVDVSKSWYRVLRGELPLDVFETPIKPRPLTTPSSKYTTEIKAKKRSREIAKTKKKRKKKKTRKRKTKTKTRLRKKKSKKT